MTVLTVLCMGNWNDRPFSTFTCLRDSSNDVSIKRLLFGLVDITKELYWKIKDMDPNNNHADYLYGAMDLSSKELLPFSFRPMDQNIDMLTKKGFVAIDDVLKCLTHIIWEFERQQLDNALVWMGKMMYIRIIIHYPSVKDTLYDKLVFNNRQLEVLNPLIRVLLDLEKYRQLKRNKLTIDKIMTFPRKTQLSLFQINLIMLDTLMFAYFWSTTTHKEQNELITTIKNLSLDPFDDSEVIVVVTYMIKWWDNQVLINRQ